MTVTEPRSAPHNPEVWRINVEPIIATTATALAGISAPRQSCSSELLILEPNSLSPLSTLRP